MKATIAKWIALYKNRRAYARLCNVFLHIYDEDIKCRIKYGQFHLTMLDIRDLNRIFLTAKRQLLEEYEAI